MSCDISLHGEATVLGDAKRFQGLDGDNLKADSDLLRVSIKLLSQPLIAVTNFTRLLTKNIDNNPYPVSFIYFLTLSHRSFREEIYSMSALIFCDSFVSNSSPFHPLESRMLRCGKGCDLATSYGLVERMLLALQV